MSNRPYFHRHLEYDFEKEYYVDQDGTPYQQIKIIEQPIDCTEAFKELANKHGYCLATINTDPSKYHDGDTQTAWLFWQAAWNMHPNQVSNHSMPDGRRIFGEDSPHNVGEHLEGLVKGQHVDCAAIIKAIRDVIKRRVVEDNSDLYGVIKMLKELTIIPARISNKDYGSGATLDTLLDRESPAASATAQPVNHVGLIKRESSLAEQQIKAIKKALVTEAMYDSCVDAIEKILSYHPPMPVSEIEDREPK